MGFTPFNSYKQREDFINSIIVFVYDCLAKWRDNPMRPNKESEKRLNPDLPKFLTSHAHKTELGINFFPEEPQEGRHTIDISVSLDNIELYNKIITVFECKRLTKAIGGERTDEYVTGHRNITGGIQRFKLEVHGKEHEIVGMIGYIQSGTYSEWLETINNCISDLCDKPDENGLNWNKNELLNTIECDEENNKYHSKSIHSRKTRPDVTIHHLWINM